MNKKEEFKDETYELAKALHYVSISQQYFEIIALGYKNGAKDLMNFYASKMKWVINNVYDRLSEESRVFFKESLIKGDTIFMDAVSEKLLLLKEADKITLEKIIDGMLKGEELRYTRIEAETAY